MNKNSKILPEEFADKYYEDLKNLMDEELNNEVEDLDKRMDSLFSRLNFINNTL